MMVRETFVWIGVRSWLIWNFAALRLVTSTVIARDEAISFGVNHLRRAPYLGIDLSAESPALTGFPTQKSQQDQPVAILLNPYKKHGYR